MEQHHKTSGNCFHKASVGPEKCSGCLSGHTASRNTSGRRGLLLTAAAEKARSPAGMDSIPKTSQRVAGLASDTADGQGTCVTGFTRCFSLIYDSEHWEKLSS